MIPYRRRGVYTNQDRRIESKEDIERYIKDLRFALNNGASINLIKERKVDAHRDNRFTNKYTLSFLFPDENPVQALRKELQLLDVSNYLYTSRDRDDPGKSELRVFGRAYNGEDVYIKIRVELISDTGKASVLVLSFHYALHDLINGNYPYK